MLINKRCSIFVIEHIFQDKVNSTWSDNKKTKKLTVTKHH